MKKLYRILFIVALFVVFGTLSSFATDDTTAPVFDPNIQTFYLLKKSTDGNTFVPENYISNVTATDDVDGKDVSISVDYNSVDISQDGQYQLLYTATDKSGNSSYLIITIVVDGIAPEFEETETTYYMSKDGVLYNSKHEVVESLPTSLKATDSMGAYNGIGVYLTDDQNGNITFVGTIENSPAVGLIELNDVLLEIDGEDVRGQSSAYAAFKIKSEETESVSLKVLRNGKEVIVPVKKSLIKLYEDQEFIAKPNMDITSLTTFENGKIEITYTATDAAGNTSEIVITVIETNEEENSSAIKEENEAIESEELEDITTSGNPPEDEMLEETEEDNDIVKDSDEVLNDENVIDDTVETEETVKLIEE